MSDGDYGKQEKVPGHRLMNDDKKKDTGRLRGRGPFYVGYHSLRVHVSSLLSVFGSVSRDPSLQPPVITVCLTRRLRFFFFLRAGGSSA